ncbi:hypothetical protein L9F63_015980, partial [Diploptera punctata]
VFSFLYSDELYDKIGFIEQQCSLVPVKVNATTMHSVINQSHRFKSRADPSSCL